MKPNFHKQTVESVLTSRDKGRHGFMVLGVERYNESSTEVAYKTLIDAGYTEHAPSDIYHDEEKHCLIFIYPEGIHFDSVRFFQIADMGSRFLPITVRPL